MCQISERQDDDLESKAELPPAGRAADHQGLAVQLLPGRDQGALPAARVRAGGHAAEGGPPRAAALRPGCGQDPALPSRGIKKTAGM